MRPKGIDVDSTGDVYVSDGTNNRVQVFDSSGNFLRQWEASIPYSPLIGNCNTGQTDPRGITVDGSNNVYVTFIAKVKKYSPSGEFIMEWGSCGSGNGQFNNAVAIDVGPNGYVYVLSAGNTSQNHRVQVFDSSGTFLHKWGGEGTANGQFKYPGGIAIDSSGNVYVADSNNYRIQKFDADGNFITSWGSWGDGDGQFMLIGAIDVDANDNVYTVDEHGVYPWGQHGRIQKFDSAGNFLAKWGSHWYQDYGPPTDEELRYPRGLAASTLGYIYVLNTDGGEVATRVQKFLTGE
jgi:DNA-binding beta-propeller fold protein YncE